MPEHILNLVVYCSRKYLQLQLNTLYKVYTNRAT